MKGATILKIQYSSHPILKLPLQSHVDDVMNPSKLWLKETMHLILWGRQGSYNASEFFHETTNLYLNNPSFVSSMLPYLFKFDALKRCHFITTIWMISSKGDISNLSKNYIIPDVLTRWLPLLKMRDMINILDLEVFKETC